MRILLSAYACEPHRGSEPEVGLQVVIAAASGHDVWVLTRANNLAVLEPHLAGLPQRARIHLVGLDLGPASLLAKRRLGQVGLYWYYRRWQSAAAVRAEALDAEVDFDLVHHVTFANFWAGAGVARLRKPLVWGPVGGAVDVPAGLMGLLGWRGALIEVVRMAARSLLWRTGGRAVARRAAVALCQNRETQRLVGALARSSVVRPNAAGIARFEVFEGTPEPGAIAVPGRLIPLKAVGLAIRALARVEDRRARLVVFGDGPERHRLARLAGRLGVADRVEFAGALSRPEYLACFQRCRMLLLPSLREQASLVVAEALSVGMPVVALDQGGPPVLAALWPDVPSRLVAPGRPRSTAAELAACVDEVLRLPPPARRWRAPTSSLADAVLAAYGQAVAG
jgi:glycosyltransferase involved in cell wall biosynthesis